MGTMVFSSGVKQLIPGSNGLIMEHKNKAVMAEAT
jgi:hypothetical protein